ncbi:hypothetical protein ENUP19_0173G0020 [Entamoeba nuttalli]|uniref:Glutamine cyclotransferase n=1 Tax=Entamoeba nuttalli TaxID=412467 RepID=A0ABQ0DMP2_9EUKA
MRSIVIGIIIICIDAVEINKCMYVSYNNEQHSISINKTYPHSKDCYTQGLIIENNNLYESCGMYGHSSINKYSFPSLQLLHTTQLNNSEFGEGITMVNNTLIMLTWKEHKCHLINPSTLDIKSTLFYPLHGWGITNDLNQTIYVSDGSNKIREIIIKNNEIQIEKEWRVQRGNGFVKELNEMQFIDNKLYINVYWEDKIIIVDLKTKYVIGEIWCNINRSGNEEVFNGIAQINSNTLLVTGKYWNKMFELTIN